jgi:hypothetical protein
MKKTDDLMPQADWEMSGDRRMHPGEFTRVHTRPLLWLAAKNQGFQTGSGLTQSRDLRDRRTGRNVRLLAVAPPPENPALAGQVAAVL